MDRSGIRLVKNPLRVTTFSQLDRPAGSQPPPRHVITAKTQEVTMDTATKTGIYKDEVGNQFLYREGSVIPAGLTYSHADETGTIERSGPVAEELDPNVRAMNAAPENRAEPFAPENRAASGKKG